MSTTVFYDPATESITIAVSDLADVSFVESDGEKGWVFTFENLKAGDLEFYWEGDKLWRPV